MSEITQTTDQQSNTKKGLPESLHSAEDLHDLIYEEAESELGRSNAALFWSGLAAGLSMGFSLIAEGLLKTYLPAADWQVLVNSFGYSFGFLIVLLGKQQLFTENTLTPVLPLLHRKDFSTFVHVARLWGVVLLANLLGTLVFSLALAYSPAFSAEVVQSFKEIGDKAMEPDFAGILVRGIFASWLIALMVWLLPAAKAAKVLVIILITYLISIAHFSHVIAGSVEVFTLAALGGTSWLNALANYILPSLIGNVIGGVVLVALLNFAQVAANKKDK